MSCGTLRDLHGEICRRYLKGNIEEDSLLNFIYYSYAGGPAQCPDTGPDGEKVFLWPVDQIEINKVTMG